MQNPDLLFQIGMGFGISLAVVLAFLALRTYKAGPDEALIITGMKIKYIDGKTGKEAWREFRVVQQGKALVLPFFERVDRISLKPRMCPFTVLDCMSQDPLPLSVQGVVQYKPGVSDEVIYIAATTLMGMSEAELNRAIQEITQKAVRTAIGKVTLQNLLKEHELIAQVAEGFIQVELSRLGLIYVSLGISEVKDGAGFLEAQGRPKAAQAKRDAAIAEIERSLEVAFREIEAKFQVERLKLLALPNKLNDPDWLDKMQTELELWLSKARRESTIRLLGTWVVIEPVMKDREGRAALDIPIRTRDGSEIKVGERVIPIEMKLGVMYVEKV